MASKQQELTHNEIWDDSALIDSWDQALEEYKVSFTTTSSRPRSVTDPLINSDAKQDSHEIDGTPTHGKLETPSEMREEEPNDRQETGNAAPQHSHPQMADVPPAPAGLLGTVRDDGLKRLLMSWYYAGYYTGFYEGQRDPLQN
ncbi:hypothetical protein NPX13_g6348 [Xylaria arbuscula]|uniref:Survival Motor Neuron Gemin2-binding domain-containing protein n=1 Tax=Xylaria arbuscula TaxID=114810 RepID=A0A9W8TK74_9PEZI|nr:hypothetical protein NPX13_g6348 [Xylaria arbuscula]